MSKVVVIDTGVLCHRAIFAWASVKKKILNGVLKETAFLPPVSYTFFQMLLGSLKRIGVNKDDTIILALDKTNSWRKAFYPLYKGQRKALREKLKHVDWKYHYSMVDKVVAQIDESTNWHVLWFPHLWNGADLLFTKEGTKFLDENKIDLGKWYGCVKGTTKIKTDNGDIEIENLTGKEKVYSYNFKTQKIELNNIINIQKTKSLHRYKLIFYGRKNKDLYITEEHPVYTTKGWKQVKDLNINDVIYHTIDYSLLNEDKLIKLGYFIGYMFADGYINKKNGKIQIDSIDYDSILNLQTICYELFNYKANILTRKPKKENHSTVYSLRISERTITQTIVDNMKLKNNKKFKNGFVGGFFDAEGTFNHKRKHIRITNTNKKLLKYVFNICEKKFLNPKFYRFKDKRENRKDIFSLDINYKKNVNKFFKKFPTFIKRKKPLQNGVKIRDIKLINYDTHQTNYNLEIYPNNNYFANNLLVHNCEADDCIAYACDYYKDREVIIVSIDADLDMLCINDNVKYFTLMTKYRGGRGTYKVIKNGYKVLSKKIEKGDISDNIIPGETDDNSENAQKKRELIIDLINLPSFVKDKLKPVFDNLQKKEIYLEKLPFQNSLAKKFFDIYKKDKIITYEDSVKRLERKKVRAKNKKIKQKQKKQKSMRKRRKNNG